MGLKIFSGLSLICIGRVCSYPQEASEHCQVPDEHLAKTTFQTRELWHLLFRSKKSTEFLYSFWHCNPDVDILLQPLAQDLRMRLYEKKGIPGFQSF